MSGDRGVEFGRDELLTLDEASRLVGVTPDELHHRIADGPVHGRLVASGGEMVAAISRGELSHHFPERYPRPGRVAAAAAEDAGARELVARLQGELAAASKIERSLQHYADKIEAKLDRAHREALTLARALGRAEDQIARLSAKPARLAEPRRPWWRRVLALR